MATYGTVCWVGCCVSPEQLHRTAPDPLPSLLCWDASICLPRTHSVPEINFALTLDLFLVSLHDVHLYQ